METQTYLSITTYCKACGGDGWLPSLPEGQSECPYCNGTGKAQGGLRRRSVTFLDRAFAPWFDRSWL